MSCRYLGRYLGRSFQAFGRETEGNLAKVPFKGSVTQKLLTESVA